MMGILLAAAITEPAPVVEILVGVILVCGGIVYGIYQKKKNKNK